MSQKTLKEKLLEAGQEPADQDTPRAQFEPVLKETAAALCELIKSEIEKNDDLARGEDAKNAAKQRVQVKLEPGFIANFGQEFLVVCEIKLPPPSSDLYRHIFFRAYIPGTFPVRLDLYEDQLAECKDLSELEDKLIKFTTFLAKSNRFRDLAEIACAQL